ncbi:MAG: ATP-binding protein [Pirellulaceae bacterium]|jgi:signal transduction histidine kinase|nr:ATP-binding protein [Pirellulaceae bacterium]
MRLTLGTRLVLAMAAIAALSIVVAVTAIVLLHRIGTDARSVARDSLPTLKAAGEMQIALSDQRGVVSSYILSEGDRSWLEQLRTAKAAFSEWSARAGADARTTDEKEVLGRLAKAYAEYDARREKAILQFDRGQRDEAVSTVRNDVWPAYHRAYHHGEELIDIIDGRLQSAAENAQRSSVLVSWYVSLGLTVITGLAVALAWLLVQRVLLPLRHMAADARIRIGYELDAADETIDDEIRLVGSYFRAIMADSANAHTALAESQSRMWNAEKLAAVGKLAASVAHEMRNPLSSMKMWLYSIQKAAGADPTLDHKCRILSDEINRLDGIVRSVLEFSRSPSLKSQPLCITRVIGDTLVIVRPWLETKKIRVVESHAAGLPHIRADSEQLKQVLVNLLNNAAEAMPGGGELSISTVADVDADGAVCVVVRVRDTGHGIPKEIQSRLFEPFFTTKREGTGLGLCIAANILAAHQGHLVLESSTVDGTTFAIRLPAAGEAHDE